MTDAAPPLAESSAARNDADRAARPRVDPAEGQRMSFGDHLEDLRACLIRALLGVAAAAVLCLVFGKQLLNIIFAPLLAALHANGLPVELQALSPQSGFNAYLKIGMLTGLVISMPWVIYQAWRFVAAGLYEREKRFARMIGPTSGGLFLVGVVFMYYVALPIVLNFFIAFNASFAMPDLSTSAFQRLLSKPEDLPAPVIGPDGPSTMTILQQDPVNPAPGSVWIDAHSRRMKVQTNAGILSMPLEQGATGSPIHSQFAIDFYISFVLDLALGFGLSFQLPVAVYFLAWLGIVSAVVMARARKYVILGIFFAAAILTPPDMLSQFLLALPMCALFEVGLLAARRTERKRAARE